MLPIQPVKNHDDSELLAMKILLVDDEPFNVALMEKILRRAGYSQINATTDARQTIAICRQHNPDLILLDLRMPHMDGFEVMRQLRDCENCQLTPIIVLTAENNQQTRLRALSEGAKDFIGKPFERHEILSRIQNTLQTRLLHNHLLQRNRSLDQMVQARTRELQREQQQLKELNDHLEELVVSRTQDLQHANEKLARANDTLSELVSIVSHELRTPLTSIKSFAEILRDEVDNLDREQQTKFLTIIDKESDRLTRLISDLLDLQKIHAGKMQWRSEILDIAKIVREATEMFLPAIRGKNLQLIVDTHDIESAKILCDTDKITQVLCNLISNAVKFTEHGHITVRISRNCRWANIMLLSKDSYTAEALSQLLDDLHVNVTVIATIEEAMARLYRDDSNISMAIIGLSANDAAAADSLEQLRKTYPSLPVATIMDSNIENQHPSPCRTGTIKTPLQLSADTRYIESLVTDLIGMVPNAPMIELAVIDTGIGIPAHDLYNVFERFFQIDTSQTRERRGSGLGLSISKEIIEHYGGKIWVHSRLGTGSSFHFLLPEFKENKKKLGEILIDKGIITEKQLAEVLRQQIRDC